MGPHFPQIGQSACKREEVPGPIGSHPWHLPGTRGAGRWPWKARPNHPQERDVCARGLGSPTQSASSALSHPG